MVKALAPEEGGENLIIYSFQAMACRSNILNEKLGLDEFKISLVTMEREQEPLIEMLV